jgi:tetratricopeptide (TPR) repeat protein
VHALFRTVLLAPALCVLAVSSCQLSAQTPKPAPATASAAQTDSFRNESLVFELSETTYRMKADGTGERIQHAILRIQSQGAAQQFGVLVISYASANETPHVTLVRVHKPDGTTIDTPTDTAIDMPAEVSRSAPLYSDLKQKHIAVRSLSVGDRLEYEVHTTIDKPEAPGQFWGAEHFVAPGTIVALAEKLNLEFPKDSYVQVWSPNHKPTISERDGLKVYSWNVPQLVPAPKTEGDESTSKPPTIKDPDEDSDGRKLPSVAWTTFKTWAEVGDWYRSLAASRAQPTDALRARAEEITRDAKTPEEQIRAIYEFVSSKIRYVGIDFGVGRYQPHQAAEVLDNQYGDCKDKDTLLESLLRAKGFSTSPALVGAGIAPVPEVPSPAIFNHVITTVDLPSGRVWLDSTPEVAPYSYLSPAIRHQKALVIPAAGPASLLGTPAEAPYPFTERFEATGTLDSEGKMLAKVSAAWRSDFEILARALARNVASAEWDKASQYMVNLLGFSGTTSKTQFTQVDNLSAPIAVTYDYNRHPFGDWDNRRIIPLFPVLLIPSISADADAPTEDIDLGAPRQLTAITRITLPDRYQADLPDPVHVKTSFATLDKTYRFDGKQITVERTVTILKNKVAKEDWKSYQKFSKDAGLDSEPWIQLIQPPQLIRLPSRPLGKTATSTAGKEPPPSSQNSVVVKAEPEPGVVVTAKDLVDKARELMQANDLVSAKATLEAAKKINPQEEYLWANLGIIARSQRNFDEAVEDFRTELKYHPQNPALVANLADTETRAGNLPAAIGVLKDYLAKHPDELSLSAQLAAYQNRAEDYTGELATLEAASAQHPDNAGLHLEAADALYRLDRKDEAAAAAKSVIEDATDPLLMNNAAYLLSETGRDLDLAESVSRKSIALLEEKSATMTAEEANRTAFNSASTLIASWDTLGWILFTNGKTDEALVYILPAWRNGLHAEVGEHLGEIYEKQGKKDEAAAVYHLAEAASGSNTPAQLRRQIREGYTRLEAAGAKPKSKDFTQELQQSRTYKLGKVSGAGGWGSFRLILTTDGVLESHKMSGADTVLPANDAIRKLKFPELLPAGSKAHLLRSGVVSCSQSSGCELVLVPGGGLQTESPQ